MTILHWIWENIWSLVAIYIIVRHGRTVYHELIFTPLAGGNGKVQMDEMAKAVLLCVFIFSVVKDAYRDTEHQAFSDNYYLYLLLCVCAIAAIKPLFSNMKHFKDPDKPAT